ncbi:MAG: nucleoside monophosphate kinase [Pirellulales bacterium]|nr:nucleoside monophosphate kinase [Pirellulales bacterium]
MKNSSMRYDALLLLGPSGVGKTPLGQLFEEHGLGGRRCVHFDFGAEMRRRVAENRPDEWIAREDIDFLSDVLRSGALLEDCHFPLAGRILQAFLTRQEADRSTLIILNGLPRHAGQAAALESIPLGPAERNDAATMSIDVAAVVYLQCDEGTIIERITTNVGGDRTDRTDDDTAEVRRRFRTFVERTLSLLEFYRRRQVKIKTVDVTATTTAAKLREQLGEWQTADRGLSGDTQNR